MISSRYLFNKRNGYNYPDEKMRVMNLDLIERLENAALVLVQCGMADNLKVFEEMAQAMVEEVIKKYN